jgi:hypothetical protein
MLCDASCEKVSSNTAVPGHVTCIARYCQHVFISFEEAQFPYLRKSLYMIHLAVPSHVLH